MKNASGAKNVFVSTCRRMQVDANALHPCTKKNPFLKKQIRET
jgi:hypothetical protein